MPFLWKASENSDQENLRWSLLRAMEWNVWPAFLSGPIVPLLLLFVPLWNIVVIVGVLTIAWSFVRYKFVNVLWADLGGLWGHLFWISVPVSVVLLLMRGHYVLAVVALIWPGISAFFGLFVGGQTGRIQEMFMAKLGYSTNNNKIIDTINNDKAIDSQKINITNYHESQGNDVDKERRDKEDLERIRQILLENDGELLNKMTKRERKILTLRMGLEDNIRCSLRSTAEQIGISAEEVGQIEAWAIRKILVLLKQEQKEKEGMTE